MTTLWALHSTATLCRLCVCMRMHGLHADVGALPDQAQNPVPQVRPVQQVHEAGGLERELRGSCGHGGGVM